MERGLAERETPPLFGTPPSLVPAAGVLELTRGDSMRALYGVCACAAQLGGGGGGKGRSGGSGGGGGGEGDDVDLPRLAGEAVLQRYALRCPAKLPLVKAMLHAQGLLG